MATPLKPGQGPKTMSSRLATMKFMQRAAASPKSSPSTPEEPSKKRQRMSNGSHQSTPDTTPNSDAQIVQASVDLEESKRQEAVQREGTAKGDTRWYLSVQQPLKPNVESPLRIVSTGYSTLDNGAGLEETNGSSMPGRLNFGNFSKKQQKQTPGAPASASEESDSDSDEEDDEDEEDDPTGAKAMIAESRKAAGAKARAERKAQKAAEAAETARLAESRRKKGVNLNKVSSISGAGKPSASSMVCHKCGEKGHIKSDCLQAAKGSKRKSY